MSWIIKGMVTSVSGSIVATLGYVLFWADFDGSLIPDVEPLAPVLALTLLMGLVVGVIGYYSRKMTATLTLTFYVLLFVTAFASVFLELPIEGIDTITNGIIGLIIVSSIAAYLEEPYDYRIEP